MNRATNLRRYEAYTAARRRAFARAALAALIGGLVAAAILAATGCAVSGTRAKTAEALDYESRPTPDAYPAAVASNTTRPAALLAERLRWRATSTVAPPPTLSQRVTGIVGSVGGIALVALIAALILCPGAVAAFALRTLSRWRTATTQIVRGIESAKLAEESGAVTEHLSRSMDASAKKIVAEVRHGK